MKFLLACVLTAAIFLLVIQTNQSFGQRFELDTRQREQIQPNQVQAFVSGVIGRQENAWWTINQEVGDQNEQVLDITIHIGDGQARFILGLVKGRIVAVQNVAINAQVDCQAEKDALRGT